jgi:hypothetical protein
MKNNGGGDMGHEWGHMMGGERGRNFSGEVTCM